ncbi:MAG TPA: discoidin domain-containing protein [Nitrososphaeraceae archaeon]|nr:discoidin domain-containing protein [Nitrososphaeraceae archaeon]
MASIVVPLSIIGLFFGLVSFSTFLYAQILPITLGIKITLPSTGQQVPTGELTISGISTDNITTDCTVYADVNNTKPFQKAVATGPGGLDDYSTWTFTYTDNYHLITNGTNNLTSKLSCIYNSNGGTTNLTKSYSVNVIGVNLDGDDDDNRTIVNANYTIPPIVNVPPQPIIVEATSQSGALVNYNVSATDNNDMLVVPICDPPSGSSFSLGNTTVNCTAIDNDGNSAVASFNVIVNMPTKTTTTFTITETGIYNETPNAVVGAAAAATDVNACNKNLEISDITAIGDDGDDAIPPNVLDDNLDTRWSHEGIGSWFQADLGAKKIICSIDIAWYRGDERSYKFAISISNDGSNFISVYSGTSSGETLSAERYAFSDLSAARYLKITISGNTDDDTDLKNWAAITEIDINGYDISTENKPPSPNTIRLNISGNYEQNSLSSSAGGLKIDPNNIEGSIALIDSTTNKKIEEYDLTPINIIVTQLLKKITIKTQIDDPITSGTVNATLNFISPIDFRNGGSYSSTATDRNILIAEVNEKTYDTKGTAEGKITIHIP